MQSCGITASYLMQSPPLNDVLGTRHVGRRFDGGESRTWRGGESRTALQVIVITSLLGRIFYSATASISLLGYNFGFFYSGRVSYLPLNLFYEVLFPLTTIWFDILGDSFSWRSFPSFGVFLFHLLILEHYFDLSYLVVLVSSSTITMCYSLEVYILSTFRIALPFFQVWEGVRVYSW